jgi:hypothetical protein
MYDRFLDIRSETIVMPKKRSSVVKPPFLYKMVDDAEIEGDPPPANTTKTKTPLTVEERQQVVSQLMIVSSWPLFGSLCKKEVKRNCVIFYCTVRIRRSNGLNLSNFI